MTLTHRSPVKWAGGKTRMLPQLLEHAVPGPWRYCEPFGGGLALFFELQARGRLIPGQTVLGDTCRGLMDFYTVLRDRPQTLDLECQLLQRQYNESTDPEAFYYRERAGYNRNDAGPVRQAARFLFLNKAGFNGLHRVSKAGEFNVPWGKRAAVTLGCAGLARAAAALHGVTLNHGDYRTTLASFQGGPRALVFFDPPYDKTWGAYSGGFDWEDQVQLAEAAAALEPGTRILATNSGTPRVRAAWRDHGFTVLDTAEKRYINRDGEGREAVPCSLFVRA